MVRRVLDRLDLVLNATKTKIVNSHEESFVFLGFKLQTRRSFKSGKLYPHVEPAGKSMGKIKAEVRRLTARERSMIPIEDVIADLNIRLRGWVGYFRYGNSYSSLNHLKIFVENRVASHLGSRHKIRLFRRSLAKYPAKRLYEEYGLYKIPVTVGWKQANASK